MRRNTLFLVGSLALGNKHSGKPGSCSCQAGAPLDQALVGVWVLFRKPVESSQAVCSSLWQCVGHFLNNYEFYHPSEMPKSRNH